MIEFLSEYYEAFNRSVAYVGVLISLISIYQSMFGFIPLFIYYSAPISYEIGHIAVLRIFKFKSIIRVLKFKNIISVVWPLNAFLESEI